jgi:UDP-GlcNAc3NAcA epimerase
MKKIIAVVGARPQFIKHAAIELAFKHRFLLKTIHTGQHYDQKMSEVFFEQFNIAKPDIMLNVGSHSHGIQTAKMMLELETIFINENPDAVLVYGDTNSTLAAALVASKLNQKIIHIEAGLRSYNRAMPEEINRILTDHVSHLLFAPTSQAVKNLNKEGIFNNVFLSPDVMADTLKMALNVLPNAHFQTHDFPYYYATIHRPSNTDDKTQLSNILTALNGLNHKIILATHPRTQQKMQSFDLQTQHFNNIIFIDPVDYFQNVFLMKNALAILTDSGGMQKEAYMLQKKCLTLRTETEWVETLHNGCNTLVYGNFKQLNELIQQPASHFIADLYGKGDAAVQIADVISQHL